MFYYVEHSWCALTDAASTFCDQKVSFGGHTEVERLFWCYERAIWSGSSNICRFHTYDRAMLLGIV